MNHPLVDNLSQLSETELVEKLADIARKYWQTNNPDVQNQMTMIMDMIKEELRQKQAKQKQDLDNKDLDNLINVS